MKKLILLFLITSVLASFNIIENPETDFIGKWKGEDETGIAYIVFEKDGYAHFELQSRVFGGKEFDFNGHKAKMNYDINLKTKYIEVDFIVTIIETQQEKRLLCIAEFVNKNELRLASNFSDKRPSSFNEENSIILIKQ